MPDVMPAVGRLVRMSITSPTAAIRAAIAPRNDAEEDEPDAEPFAVRRERMHIVEAVEQRRSRRRRRHLQRGDRCAGRRSEHLGRDVAVRGRRHLRDRERRGPRDGACRLQRLGGVGHPAERRATSVAETLPYADLDSARWTHHDVDCNDTPSSDGRVTGRFAPSPTGDLHLGNLRTAAVAWLSARSRAGPVPRAHGGSRPAPVQRRQRAAATPRPDRVGIDWDGEVIRQSDRFAIYDAAIDELRRARARRTSASAPAGRSSPRSPRRRPHRTARRVRIPGRAATSTPTPCAAHRDAGRRPALRLRTDGHSIAFDDRFVGRVRGHDRRRRAPAQRRRSGVQPRGRGRRRRCRASTTWSAATTSCRRPRARSTCSASSGCRSPRTCTSRSCWAPTANGWRSGMVPSRWAISRPPA